MNSDIQSQVDAINARLDQMSQSSTLPRSLETALRERLGDIRNTTKTASTTPTVVSGGGGGTVAVPTVLGTFPIVINGKIYNILFQ